LTGTLINVGTVLAGGVIGSLVGSRFPPALRATLLQAVGLTTLAIGLQRVLGTTNVLVLLVSVAIGAVIGEILRIEAGLQHIGVLAERALAPLAPPPSAGEGPGGGRPPHPNPLPEGEGVRSPRHLTPDPQPLASRGFVTASLIFCVGPMTILGSFEDGLTGAYQTLALKATLDGITAAVLASSLGWGVLLAAGTVLVYQGALTLGAGLLRGLLTDPMIVEMTAVGGLLILGIGLNILELSRIRVGSMLPALVIAPALVALSSARGTG